MRSDFSLKFESIEAALDIYNGVRRFDEPF